MSPQRKMNETFDESMTPLRMKKSKENIINCSPTNLPFSNALTKKVGKMNEVCIFFFVIE